MQCYTYKDFNSSLQKLNRNGGAAQTKASKAYSVFGKAASGDNNPFHGLSVTNHGESRIEHCVKYELGDGYRLITIKDDNICLFCFVGKHDLADSWLESHKGLKAVVSKDGVVDVTNISSDISVQDKRISSQSDFAKSSLILRLEGADFVYFSKYIPQELLQNIILLNTMSTEDEIKNIASLASTTELENLLFDVLMQLRAGNKSEAIQRIDVYSGAAKIVSELTEEELVEIPDGMNVKRVVIGSQEYVEWIGRFIKSSGYQDWMLFMHPEQQRLVDAEYEGPTKLSGVSGSGKTCIIVNRAISLAKKGSDGKILITTLNRSLARLINDLLDYACPDEELRSIITCKSFFDICRELLIRLEPDNTKLYEEFTWKTAEHIDEIWREFYRCKCNNDDAMILFPLHKSLNSQSIVPEEYIKQEFDWARSACGLRDRDEYIKIERKGRAIPFLSHQRQLVLDGIAMWESKMAFVGSIDYLGLAVRLHAYIDSIAPEYSSILIDEAQDFGTIELELLRKLVHQGRNDIFLAGDMAQHILPKHQSFTKAGIPVPGARSFSIRKNYRNSREILRAAYDVLMNAVNEDFIMEGELEILNPEYANFSTPKPALLKTDTLAKEISYALSHLSECKANRDNFKGCITIVGYTWLEIKRFADRIGLTMLDGNSSLNAGDLFVSDLEQTKGYEFDTMCIVNCNKNILPPINMPENEHFRDACRFYVAMTRAKQELIISYSSEMTDWVSNEKCLARFEVEDWSSYVDESSITLNGIPDFLSTTTNPTGDNVANMTGVQFLFTKHSIGLPLSLQDKMESLIDGTSLSRNSQKQKWTNIKSAYGDVLLHPHAKNLFGSKTWNQFVELMKPILRND